MRKGGGGRRKLREGDVGEGFARGDIDTLSL